MNCRKKGTGFTSALAVCVALSTFGGAAVVLASKRGSDKVREDLVATAAAPAGARGRAVVRVRSENGRLTVVAKDIGADGTFDVILDGVKIGTLRTTGGGNGRARFRTRPRGRDQLLGTDPRGKTLILRSASGSDVLVADLPTRVDPTPGNSNDDDIVCCLPDDSGEECEDRTPAECAAQGGRDLGPGSCIPNPCGGGPVSGGDVICCIPDDGPAECEDRTPAECAAAGGIVIGGATSCAGNPCAPVPPADPDIQCCLPDDSGPECEDRTPETCAAQGGVNMGPGTCTPNPCSGSGVPDADIQCCVPDDSGPKCEDRTPAECAARGGVDRGPGTCSPNPCG